MTQAASTCASSSAHYQLVCSLKDVRESEASTSRTTSRQFDMVQVHDADVEGDEAGLSCSAISDNTVCWESDSHGCRHLSHSQAARTELQLGRQRHAQSAPLIMLAASYQSPKTPADTTSDAMLARGLKVMRVTWDGLPRTRD